MSFRTTILASTIAVMGLGSYAIAQNVTPGLPTTPPSAEIQVQETNPGSLKMEENENRRYAHKKHKRGHKKHRRGGKRGDCKGKKAKDSRETSVDDA